MIKLKRKGYGRIYVKDEKHIERVKQIIKEMDQFEYEYLPEDLITTLDQYPKTAYTYKFDNINIDMLTYKCIKEDIIILCIDNSKNEFLREDDTAY